MIKLLYIGHLNKGYRVLEALLDLKEEIKVMAVIPPNDDYGKHWYKSVAQLAGENDIPVLMSDDINSESFCKMIKEKFDPDWGLSNGSGMRLYKECLFGMPKNGFLNIHFSPLPKYRGVYPIPYAIINDEKTHGFTVHKIDAGMDTGSIAYSKSFPIYEYDTAFEAYYRCESLVVEFAQNELLNILKNPAFTPQDDLLATTYRLKDMKEKRATLGEGIKYFYDFVRAFDFPPYELPFIDIDRGGRYRLSIYPFRHGIETPDFFIPYKRYKIYFAKEDK